ncbi:MAG: DUF2169 domain-containing protein [Myxococcales bacterium]|nr:DUF2169 domain-containing protein [Myxococcales bacterium]
MPALRKGYWVELLPAERCDGTVAVAFIAKRTFKIAADSAVLEALPDEEQPPLLATDRCDEGKPDKAAPTVEVELVPEKFRVDVIVVGKALAPGGKALKEWEVGIRLGDRTQRLRILGPRRCKFVPPKKQGDKFVDQLPQFSEPEPVKEVPLTFTNAYGGWTHVIPDDETLRIQREVDKVVGAEQAEAQAKKAAAQADQKKKDEVAAKEKKVQEMFEDLGKKGPKDEKLKRGYGEEGFDEDGVRLWGAAAAKDGTAVLSLEEFDKQELAEMARLEREAQEAAERAAKAAAEATNKPAERKLRRNALGEMIEVDDGVDLLSDAEWEKQQAADAVQAEAEHIAQAKLAKKRSREQVQQNDGTQVMEAMDDDDAPGPDVWEKDLKANVDVGDQAERKAWEQRVAERKKAEAEKLKEFPQMPCPTNPFGKGFLVSNRQILVEKLELPLIEDPAAPLTPRDLMQDWLQLDKVPLPAGFSCWPRQARPRIDLAGPLPSGLTGWDKKLDEEKRKLDLTKEEDVAALRELDRRGKPVVMQPGWYNSAAPTMQWGNLYGDEECTLTHLTKEGTLFFKLPGKVIEAELDRGRGIERKDMKLDTVVIDLEPRTVTLVWRTHYPMASMDELETYPHFVGWVLDLDIADKRNKDWAENLKKSQGDGTAVLDLNAMPLEAEPYLPPRPLDAKPEDDALDIEKMGMYRQVHDDGWDVEASGGVIDVKGEAKKKKAEEEYVKQKTEALKALEATEKKEKERREEVGAAVAAGKPVPPKDGPKKGKPPEPPPPETPKPAAPLPAPAPQPKKKKG